MNETGPLIIIDYVGCLTPPSYTDIEARNAKIDIIMKEFTDICKKHNWKYKEHIN